MNSRPWEDLDYRYGVFTPAHPYCQAAPWFPRNGRDAVVPLRPPVRISAQYSAGEEIHHLPIGVTDRRWDVETALLACSHFAHLWIGQFEIPGFVFSCYCKMQENELDWPVLERIMGKSLPSWLDTDRVIGQVAEFPWLEPYRLELVEESQ